MRTNFFFLWVATRNVSQWTRIADTATLRTFLPHSEMIWAVCFLPTNKKNSPTFTSALTGDENLFFDKIRGETPKRRFTCSFCHQEGHSRRTCPSNPNRVNELDPQVHQSLYSRYPTGSSIGETNGSSSIFSDDIGNTILNNSSMQDYTQFINNIMPILEKINKSKCGTSESFVWAACLAANLHNSYEVPPWYLTSGFNGNKHTDLCPLLVPNELYEHVLINLTEMLHDPASTTYSIPSVSNQYFDSHSDGQIISTASVSPAPSSSYSNFNSISKMSSFSNSMSRPVDNLDIIGYSNETNNDSPSLINSSFGSLTNGELVNLSISSSANSLADQTMIPVREVTPPPLSIVDHILPNVHGSTNGSNALFLQQHTHLPSSSNVPSLKMAPIELS
eukprot:TRINITY_DN2554_c0_g1_i1.p1 TRINITY_DN2554_c0_g1~~TRINITY_DN2554_c0_g1_i1.p1  ORF type:complete len:392 (-),score=96.69 TRINITY_DN2554_c0_g1_i1:56-1231(-)